MNKYYVYVILNPNKPGNFEYDEIKFKYEPFYIGKGVGDRYLNTTNLKRSSGYKRSVLIHLEKKGVKPIVEKIFENLSIEESLELEIKLINLIGRKDIGKGPLTNLTDGGDGRTNGKNPEESIKKQRSKLLETNQKKRDMGYDFSMTEESKEKLRSINVGENNPMWGKTHTEEIKEKHSLRVSGTNHPMFGKKHNNETRNKIRESRKGINQEEVNRISSETNSKKIIQYSIEGEFISEFNSIKEASKILGISESLIGKTCRGVVKNPRKFVFKFKNEKDLELKNSYLIKIGDIYESMILIKRNKKSVIVEKFGEIITLRKKEYPIFWTKKELEKELM